MFLVVNAELGDLETGEGSAPGKVVGTAGLLAWASSRFAPVASLVEAIDAARSHGFSVYSLPTGETGAVDPSDPSWRALEALGHAFLVKLGPTAEDPAAIRWQAPDGRVRETTLPTYIAAQLLTGP